MSHCIRGALSALFARYRAPSGFGRPATTRDGRESGGRETRRARGSRLCFPLPTATALALASLLGLAACSQGEAGHPLGSLGKIDLLDGLRQLNRPGLLGSLIDRKPPPVSLRASGPYPGPLSDAMPPILTTQLADQVVAAPLRASLTPDARMDLARASVLAATVATGTAVPWKAAKAQGIVVAARDVYISPHGLVCRDLQQAVREAGTEKIEPVTLCREDIGADRRAWRPATVD